VKVIIIGAVKFSLEMLKVIDQYANVVGVITSKSSVMNSDFADLSPYCHSKGIPVHKTNDVNTDGTLEWVFEKEADVIFCLGWSRLIKRSLLDSVQAGVIGYHPAALPNNRGRHPMIWALALGLSETASTFFFMDEGVDSGDILSQQKIVINDEVDASLLYEKIIDVAKEQLSHILPQLEDGSYSRTPQNHSMANYWRKRGISDGKIDWRMSAKSIHNLIRALTHPYMGAHFIHHGVKYTVWRSRVTECSNAYNAEPGKVIASDHNNLLIKCGNNCISILEVDPKVPILEGGYL